MPSPNRVEVRDPDVGSLLDLGDPVADPAGVEVQLGQDQPAGGFPEIAGQVLFGKDAPQDLVGAPAHRSDGGNAEPLVDLRAAGIVDPGHDVRDVERLTGNAGGQDVGVVAAGDRSEGVRLGDSGLLQRVPVKPDAGDLPAGEALAEPAEGAVVLVDDGHGVAGVLERVRQRCSHPAASHDHEVRHPYLLNFPGPLLLLELYRPRAAIPSAARQAVPAPAATGSGAPAASGSGCRWPMPPAVTWRTRAVGMS